MKNLIKKWPWWGIGILLGLLFSAQSAVMAQTPSTQIKNLLVELWPEYDQPQTLVIYHVELASTTALPAQLTFRLPGYLEKMFVVAVEQDGKLVEVKAEAIQLQHEGDSLLLTFSTPSPKVQFEYYDPVIMKKDGQKRQLNFDFTASYGTAKATFQVQEPAGAENFAVTPPPSTSFTGSDGMKYNAIEIPGLAAKETFKLAATYTRTSDQLSTELVSGTTTEHAADLAVVAEPPPNENLTLGYGLIGIGAAVLLGVAGYWWWSKRNTSAPAVRPGPRPSRRKAAAKASSKAAPQPQPIPTSSKFCYRCGASLREDSNFCHACGAERRKE